MNSKQIVNRRIIPNIQESFFSRSLISRTAFLFAVYIVLLASYAIDIHGQSVQKDVGISVTIEHATPTPTPTVTLEGGGGVGPPPSAATNVVFEGKAYPSSLITILKDGTVTSTFTAEPSGFFRKGLTGYTPGIYTFGIFAEDTDERVSVTLNFTISLMSGTTTTIGSIFLPPTFSLHPNQIEKGGIIRLEGQVFPESIVKIFISPDDKFKDTTATSEGKWFYDLDTSSFGEKEYRARVMALSQTGEQSPFSQTLAFSVLKPVRPSCRGADLNFDGQVDLIDFSILLFFWGETNPSNRCADINSDGIVNIVDFSVMMYWWTG